MDHSEPTSKCHWLWTVLAYGGAVLLFLLYGNFEVSRSIYDDDARFSFLERLNPWGRELVVWSAFGACLLLLAFASVSFRTKWLRWPVLGLLIGFVLYPYCVIAHVVSNLGPWTTHGEITTEDGRTFVFCDSSFLQGQVMAIAEIVAKDSLKTTYRVLVDNNGDSPRSWASVVRPAGALDEYGQLYLNNGLLIGVRYDNKCFLAYDIAKSKPYGHGDVELLSPFVCLSASDVLNEVDVQRTCERIQEQATFCEASADIRHAQSFVNGEPIPGCPSPTLLRDAVATKPPPVASAATVMLDCYGDAYSRLTRHIAEQTDADRPK
jgi:hypothetical protein